MASEWCEDCGGLGVIYCECGGDQCVCGVEYTYCSSCDAREFDDDGFAEVRHGS